MIVTASTDCRSVRWPDISIIGYGTMPDRITPALISFIAFSNLFGAGHLEADGSARLVIAFIVWIGLPAWQTSEWLRLSATPADTRCRPASEPPGSMIAPAMSYV